MFWVRRGDETSYISFSVYDLLFKSHNLSSIKCTADGVFRGASTSKDDNFGSIFGLPLFSSCRLYAVISPYTLLCARSLSLCRCDACSSVYVHLSIRPYSNRRIQIGL